MSRSVNRIILVGNTGSAPEIRATSSGKKVAKVSLATNRSWTDQSGTRREETQWHRLTFWDRLADVVEEYVEKGDRLYIEGRVEYSETEHEGVTRYWTDVIVQELVMLGGGEGAPAPIGPPGDTTPVEDYPDLPF